MTNKSVISWAIIPARGGSKGIPRKNIKLLCGKPLIAWTIEAALKAELVERVIVSTDDHAIAEVAQNYGAELVMRPDYLADDFSRSEDALLHVLETEAAAGQVMPPAIAFLQCTSPLTLARDIDGTVAMVLDQGYDSAVTGTPFHYFIWTPDEHGGFHGVNHEATRRLMRQERRPEYLEVGAVYAMRAAMFLRARFRFFGKTGLFPIPASRALEIDEPDDWEVAERAMRAVQPPAITLAGLKSVADLDLRDVKAVVTDFDGVLTDNRVETFVDGRESVVCNRSDGWAANLLRQAGIPVACVSTEKNEVVARRCEKMGLVYCHGADDKLAVLKEFCAGWGVSLKDVLYIGNDTNDADCLCAAGWGIIPSDAVVSIANLADGYTRTCGGGGVLREVASAVLEQIRR